MNLFYQNDSDFEPNPGVCPVPDGTPVDVKYQSGEIKLGVIVGVPADSDNLFLAANNWRPDPDLPNTIVAWRRSFELYARYSHDETIGIMVVFSSLWAFVSVIGAF